MKAMKMTTRIVINILIYFKFENYYILNSFCMDHLSFTHCIVISYIEINEDIDFYLLLADSTRRCSEFCEINCVSIVIIISINRDDDTYYDDRYKKKLNAYLISPDFKAHFHQF